MNIVNIIKKKKMKKMKNRNPDYFISIFFNKDNSYRTLKNFSITLIQHNKTSVFALRDILISF